MLYSSDVPVKFDTRRYPPHSHRPAPARHAALSAIGALMAATSYLFVLAASMKALPSLF